MKLLAVHPSPLLYTRTHVRLEPLGLELAATAARRAGHQVRLIDLQVEQENTYSRMLRRWRPDAVAISCNYLANVPEVVDLCKLAKAMLPGCFVFVGGHSASFIASELLEHGAGSIDCVLRGEAEPTVAELLLVAEEDRGAISRVPGAVTLDGVGPPPPLVENLDDLQPTRELLRKPRRYFMGALDPCASIEFSRGCPWDCTFCSAWTFYGRSYRQVSPEVAAERLQQISEPGVWVVDDVAFIQGESALEIGEAIARRGIRKRYFLETRVDVLLRNKEAFKFWKQLGLEYLFLGMEALNDEDLKRFRKRVTADKNLEALEFARSLGLIVIVGLIIGLDWDRRRFQAVRQWCAELPGTASTTIETPYPGTEMWHTAAQRLTSRDYRLFDILHAVLPTKLPLREFYKEYVRTNPAMVAGPSGWRQFAYALTAAPTLLARGQTNLLRRLWTRDRTLDANTLLAHHTQPPEYELPLPPPAKADNDASALYIHAGTSS
ncbi:MAG: hopanoid C-3 methylase HpnR [Acidobacteriota bacterium]